MEVFLFEISHRVSGAVAHHHRNVHQVGLHLECRGFLGGDHFVILRWRGRRDHPWGRFGWRYRRRGWRDVQSQHHFFGFRLAILRCLRLGRRRLGHLRHLRRTLIGIAVARLHVELAPVA